MRLCTLSTAFLLAIPAVSSFSFSVDTPAPSQCDNISISWTGGQAPFQILMIPVFGVPQNFSISDGNHFRTQLPFPSGSKFLVSMSDSSGFSGGLTSQLLTVGPSTGGSCNATTGTVSFTFSLNTALQQCRPYTFSDYAQAVQPITILGLIPSGQIFVLSPPVSSTSYDWVANTASGTSIVFVMFDSLGRQGGSSAVETVGPSNDNSCLGPSSPSSTSILPTSTSSSPSNPSQSPGAAISPGVIAGTVLGGLVLLAVFVSLGLFLLRRFASNQRGDRGYRDSRGSQRFSLHNALDSEFDTSPLPQRQPPAHYPYPLSPGTSVAPDSVSTQYLLSDQYTPTPFITPPASQGYNSTPPFGNANVSSSTDQFGVQSSSMSSGQRKAAMAGMTNNSAARFILHTDADDIGPNQDGVIELPPQYSANRAPVQPNVFPPP